MSSGELDIQKMLVQRLTRQVEALEKEKDLLVQRLQKLSKETAAKIYTLEVEKDRAEHQRDEAKVKLKALESKLNASRRRIADLRALADEEGLD